MIRSAPLLTLAAGSAVFSCRPTADTSPPAPVSETQESDPAKEAAPMGEHFLQASKIKDKIIEGELGATRRPAQWLLDNVVADQVPVRWRAHVPRVHRGAKLVLDAEDLRAAAVGVTELAQQCAACHQDVGVEVAPSFQSPPLQDNTTFGHMDRHGYGVDRMWEGLVGPSDEAWVEGARALSEAPLHNEKIGAAVKDLAGRVHGLAASALSQDDPAERAGHLAEILTTCADCHTKTRG